MAGSPHSPLDIERDIILDNAVSEAVKKSKEIRSLEEVYRQNYASHNKKNSYRRHSAVAQAFSETAEVLELATAELERGRERERVRRNTRLGLRQPFSRRMQSQARRRVSLALEDNRQLEELLGQCHLNEANSCKELSRYRSYSGACNSLQLPTLGRNYQGSGR